MMAINVPTSVCRERCIRQGIHSWEYHVGVAFVATRFDLQGYIDMIF